MIWVDDSYVLFVFILKFIYFCIGNGMLNFGKVFCVVLN